MRILGIDTPAPGGATGRFTDYTTAANAALLHLAYATCSRLLSPPSFGRALPTIVDISVGPMPAGPGKALSRAGDGAGPAD
jgi:hypothetical protein